MQEVSITTEGIQKNLKSFKPLDALCEYIWNGFDAQADRVDVKLYTNEFGLLNMISIEDNGTGIVYEELGDKFKPFNDSKKYDISKKVNHSLPHGRQGIGRLTFLLLLNGPDGIQCMKRVETNMNIILIWKRIL